MGNIGHSSVHHKQPSDALGYDAPLNQSGLNPISDPLFFGIHSAFPLILVARPNCSFHLGRFLDRTAVLGLAYTDYI